MRALAMFLFINVMFIACGSMGNFASIIIYQGTIEDVSIFETYLDAIGWLAELRGLYGWENTSDSVTWDIVKQLPLEVQADPRLETIR